MRHRLTCDHMRITPFCGASRAWPDMLQTQSGSLSTLVNGVWCRRKLLLSSWFDSRHCQGRVDACARTEVNESCLSCVAGTLVTIFISKTLCVCKGWELSLPMGLFRWVLVLRQGFASTSS